MPRLVECAFDDSTDYGFRVRHYLIKGVNWAALEASARCSASEWFVLTPLPDDYFRFTVKDESPPRPAR